MSTRRAFFPLIVALLVGCSADTQEPGFFTLRRWPMNVPGMMDPFEPVVDVEGGEAVPEQGWSICGKIFYCCYEIRCEDGKRSTSYDFPVCPARWRRPETREEAWRIWDGLVTATMANKSKTTYPICVKETAICYDHTHGRGVCFNYPNRGTEWQLLRLFDR